MNLHEINPNSLRIYVILDNYCRIGLGLIIP